MRVHACRPRPIYIVSRNKQPIAYWPFELSVRLLPKTVFAVDSGFRDYLERYSFIVNDTQATFGPAVHCTPDSDTARHIIQELEAKLPADQRKNRCLWRNQCLAGLAKLKSQLPR